MSIFIGDTEIKDICLGEGVDDYSAMQGPAPDGFHVPLNTERQAVKDVRTSLGGGSSDGTNFGIALKLPFAGYRSTNSSANVNFQGSRGYYWSSFRYNSNNSYNLYIGSAVLNSQNANFRAIGFSVRCFKNSPTTPTSSWTKLYGTSIEAGGIFWSSADGLISLSSDGQTWITIADKNLGATQVWNSGDTLSQSNCGYYYQRGNNYGFPRTGSVTTSSTQVNASNYGPGNYYSSSTYIVGNTDWSSVQNDNLRGGMTKKGNVKEVYVGTTKVRHIIVNWKTQGPCADEFHVPLYDELVALNNAGITLGAWTSSGGDNMRIYLKLPFTGYRLYTNGNANLVAQCSYWSANVYSDDRKDLIKTMTIASNQINLAGASNNGFGEPIRPFSNIAVPPDSSWTVLYQGTGNAGIYHNSSLGVISISSNGTTWITISDKNLGATQVYNNGDTLSDANCGKLYQRGNNYGFPRSGGITTSSTTIDVSTYGPGNYYSSSTFIKDSCWTSTLNDNLRGGVDGNVPV